MKLSGFGRCLRPVFLCLQIEKHCFGKRNYIIRLFYANFLKKINNLFLISGLYVDIYVRNEGKLNLAKKGVAYEKHQKYQKFPRAFKRFPAHAKVTYHVDYHDRDGAAKILYRLMTDPKLTRPEFNISFDSDGWTTITNKGNGLFRRVFSAS